MSYDLYLLNLSPGDDAQTAITRIEALNRQSLSGTGHSAKKERLARLLMNLDPRFKPFDKDYAAIAEFDGITLEEARRRYDEIELNGPRGEKLAQFTIHGSHILIHWHSGTSAEEMDRYLHALCRESGYAVFDPQTSEITRYAPEDSEP